MASREEMDLIIAEVWNPLADTVAFMRPMDSEAVIAWLSGDLAAFSGHVIRSAMREEFREPRPDFRKLRSRCMEIQPMRSSRLTQFVQDIQVGKLTHGRMLDSPFYLMVQWADHARGIFCWVINARYPDRQERMLISEDQKDWGWEFFSKSRFDELWPAALAEFKGKAPAIIRVAVGGAKITVGESEPVEPYDKDRPDSIPF